MVCQWCLRVDETWYKNILLGMCVIQAHVRKFMKYRKNAKTINTRGNTVLISTPL